MKRFVAVAGMGVALAFAGCGGDASREDAQDTRNVDRTPPEVAAFNNHFPNIEHKCDGHGHRIYVMSHDSAKGRNFEVIVDPTCPGGLSQPTR